jgi:hypothetical protein
MPPAEPIGTASLSRVVAQPRRRRNIDGQGGRSILEADGFIGQGGTGDSDILDSVDVVVQEHARVEPQLIVDEIRLGIGSFIDQGSDLRLSCSLGSPCQRDERKQEQDDYMHEPADQPGQNQQRKKSGGSFVAGQNEPADDRYRS